MISFEYDLRDVIINLYCYVLAELLAPSTIFFVGFSL
jgi:hypothetical protein